MQLQIPNRIYNISLLIEFSHNTCTMYVLYMILCVTSINPHCAINRHIISPFAYVNYSINQKGYICVSQASNATKCLKLYILFNIQIVENFAISYFYSAGNRKLCE